MKKIKQIISLALVFALLGGCAAIDKSFREEEQTTEIQSSSTQVTTAAQTEEYTAAETRLTELVSSTEKTTASTTVKREETASSTHKVTEKPTTARITVTESTSAVNKPATTKTVTTTREETTTAVITEAPATLPKQNSEGIIIGLKNIRFGCDMQQITDTFGNPSETVTETLSAGGTVKSLVYAEDYSEFAVFQLLNGKLFAFYTVDKNTIITDGESSYSLRSGGDTEFGNVEITVYEDNKKGGKAYALKASFNGFDYLPHELSSLDGQERLNFHTTNAVRAINGKSSLEYSEKASACVRKHCEDMSARNYFSHDTPEGVTSSQRMRNSGIEYTSCAENLAAGYLDAFGIVDGWYNSSGHRKNLLDEKYRYLGVGVAQGNESYNIYAGQNYYA